MLRRRFAFLALQLPCQFARPPPVISFALSLTLSLSVSLVPLCLSLALSLSADCCCRGFLGSVALNALELMFMGASSTAAAAAPGTAALSGGFVSPWLYCPLVLALCSAPLSQGSAGPLKKQACSQRTPRIGYRIGARADSNQPNTRPLLYSL